MVKFRPHRGGLIEAMKEFRLFATIDEMKSYLIESHSDSQGNHMFEVSDIVIDESHGADERIGWKESRYVCVKRYGDASYDIPQCIAMCSIEDDIQLGDKNLFPTIEAQQRLLAEYHLKRFMESQGVCIRPTSTD